MFTPALTDGLSLESEWHQADLKNALVWMILILPPIYNYSIPLSTRLRIVPSAPITTGITVTFKFLKRVLSTCLSFRFLCFFLCGLLG